jgi:hypothetical protein
MKTKPKVSRAVRREAKEAAAFLLGLDKPKPDPALAAIAAHKAACAAYAKPRKMAANMVPTNPRYKAAMAAERKAGGKEMKTLLALLACRPTTLHGVQALLEHFGQPEWLIYEGEGTGDSVLSGAHEYNPTSDVKKVVKLLPLRLAGALREIIGRETEGRRQ